MAGDWKSLPLASLLAEERGISYGIVQPGSHQEDGVPIVRVADIRNGRIATSQPLRVAPEIEAAYARTRLRGGELLLTLVGTVGESAVVPSELAGWNVARAVAVIPVREDIGAYWVKLALNAPEAREMIYGRLNTTVQATLNLKDVSQLPIFLPDSDERKSISNVIGSLEEKIELNRRMNETLEALARAIFKSWFVDFDPVRAKASGEPPESICRRLRLTPDLLALFPDRLVDSELGEIPEGWVWSSIGDEVDIVGGGTPSTKESRYWDGGSFHWTTPKDLSGNPDNVLLKTERKITQEGLETISSGLLPVDTVLLSSRAPVGYLAIAKVPTAINQGFIAMKCDKLLTPEYVLQWANSAMDEIKQRASGTTFAEISKRNFRPIKVVVPTSDVMDEYTSVVRAMYDKVSLNVAESDSLGQIRDSLLPKLLSGELLVTEAMNE